MSKTGATEAEPMGHAEAGMSESYGTKAARKPVVIVRFDRSVRTLDRAFREALGRAPSG